MNNELNRIISLYQEAVSDLFPRLADYLGVQLPIKNTDWATLKIEQTGITDCGIEYFTHGYGVSMKYENIKVDFDLGDNGQIDGIDPWKLWNYLKESNITTAYQSVNQINKAVKEASNNGDLIYSGYLLYYLAE